MRRLIKAAGYSWQGFRAAWKNEPAFKQEAVGCLILIPLGVWLGDNGTERALLIFSVLLVPLVELLNSAIESVVDRHGAEHHPLSGRAKDMGSASVLMALIILLVVWASVLFTD